MLLERQSLTPLLCNRDKQSQSARSQNLSLTALPPPTRAKKISSTQSCIERGVFLEKHSPFHEAYSYGERMHWPKTMYVARNKKIFFFQWSMSFLVKNLKC